MDIVFKNETRLGNKFHLKDRIPQDFKSGVAYKFQCVFWNVSYYGEFVRHLGVRICEILVYHHLRKNKLSLRAAP